MRLQRACVLIVAGAVLVACASSRSATPAGGGDVSGGDALTAAAIAKVASFQCPETATRAGRVSAPLPAGRKLRVVTTVAPITSVVGNVAGERAEVRGVVPEGSDSHAYEPKPSVAERFTTADVVFLNGLSLEEPTKDLAEANLGPNAQVVELGSLVLSPDQYIYDFSFPREGGKPNPHLWTDLPMARCYAVAAASVLSRADPANADYYRANASAFEAKIDDLDQRFRTASGTVAPANRALLTYHDAFAYFAATYGWRVIGAIQVSSFEDPSPKDVAGLIGQVRLEKVPAIFGSEVFPSPVLAEIGKEAGVKYVDELRDDDLPGAPGAPDHSYLGLMQADFVTMVSSLGGDAGVLTTFDPADVVHDSAEYAQ